MSLWDDTNIFMLIGVHVNLFQKKVKKNKISGTKPYNVKLDLLYTTWMSAITIFHYFLQFVKYIIMLMKVKFTQSCPTLYEHMDSIVHGILQARILEWIAFPFSRRSSQPRDRTHVSHITGGFFTSWATRNGRLVFKSSIGWLLFLDEPL